MGCDVVLKWLNDVLVDGCKICGIFVEVMIGVVVFGVGVNMCMMVE